MVGTAICTTAPFKSALVSPVSPVFPVGTDPGWVWVFWKENRARGRGGPLMLDLP
jgi:hypothetical protein